MDRTLLSPQSRLTLRLTMPDGSTRTITLDKPVLTLGRAPDNDVIIEHSTISRHHARLIVDAGRLLIEDLGSSNGTFVGGVRLEVGKPVEAPLGKLFQVGHVALESASAGFSAGESVGSATVVAKPSTAQGSSAAIPGVPPVQKPFPTKKILVAGGIGIGVLALLLLIGVALYLGLNRLRKPGQGKQAELRPFVCQQQPMSLYAYGGMYYSASFIQAGGFQTTIIMQTATPPPATISSEPQPPPLLNTAFLELPFPYDGGNENFGGSDEQFQTASQRRSEGGGGRVNSFFDHYLPLYPAPKDPGSPGGEEPAESPIGNNVLPFDGFINPYFAYSGHPGYDYSTFAYHQPTTPIFAAADGIIDTVGIHTSGAYYVKVRHIVQGVGEFMTIYWHLHPDDWFEHTSGREGETVAAGERLGTMGNTGYSTGHHLHFEVRFDRDQDGIFTLDEVVDPYGYVPSLDYPDDPWEERTGAKSMYLWTHPLGSIAGIAEDGSGQLDMSDTGGEFPASSCAQPGGLPPGGVVYYTWAPDPPSTSSTAGTGNGCALSVLDAQGKPVSKFDKPLTITIPFSDDEIAGLDPDTLAIYWLASGSNLWMPLQTQIDFESKVAVATTDRPGKCSLMGQPTQDKLPPTTQIEVSGEKSADGSFYGQVTVSLTSSDPSGIQESYFSLDNGSTWQRYSAPFTLQPGEIPTRTVMDGQFFGGLPGTYLVLAYSKDGQGNVEEPPAMAYLSIDKTKDPQYEPAAVEEEGAVIAGGKRPTPSPTSTPSPTRTVTPSPTASSTPTQTPTPTETPIPACKATLKLTKNANCRKGPGTVYDVLTAYLEGQELVIDGINDPDESSGSNWFWVKVLDSERGHCWISAANANVSGDTRCFPVIPAPPTPTPVPPTSSATPTPVSPTPSATPTLTPEVTKPIDIIPPKAPALISPADDISFGCVSNVTLSWGTPYDESGISQYHYVVDFYDPSTYSYSLYASGIETTNSVVVSMECGVQYRWTVRAFDGAGNPGAWADYWIFIVYSE